MTAPAAQRRTAAIGEWDAGYKALVVQTIMRPKDRQPTGPEIAMFAEQVQRTKLDPFLKQIYAIYRYDSRLKAEAMQVQVAIDGFRLIAHRTKEYEGQEGPFWCGPDGVWQDVWLSGEPPTAAKVGVWRTGARTPFWGVARFNAYAQRFQDGNLMSLWSNMGDNQIAKCAEALALRKGFPAELSGLYTPEEMEQAADDQPPAHDAVTTAVEEPVELDRSSLVEAFDRAVGEGVPDGKIKAILVAHGAEDTSDLVVTLQALPAESIGDLIKAFDTAAMNAVDAREALKEAANG